MCFVICLKLSFKFLSAVILAIVGNYWIIIPSFFLFLSLVFLRAYYLRTSRDIKRLEAIGNYVFMKVVV